MSYHFEFDSGSRIHLAVVQGRINDSELQELYFEMQKRPLIGILDLTGVTDFDVRSETIRGLANLPPTAQSPRLRAVVAPTDSLFGIVRMFQLRGAATRERLHIVRTLREALELLGVSSPQFRREAA